MKNYILSLFLLLIVFNFDTSAQIIPPKTNEVIRVMSYNVRICRGMDDIIDYERVANVIKKVSPDVVALQELDSATQRSNGLFTIKELANHTNMYYTFAPAIDHQGGTYGVGILSKEKPIHYKMYSLPGREENRMFLMAEFENYIVCCTHFSLTKEDRLASANMILEIVSDTNKPLFLGGDMNCIYDSPPQEILRKKFITLNDPKANTIPVVNPTRCIDYIYGYENGHNYTVMHRDVLDEPVASDHLPLYVDVRIEKNNK